MTKHAGIATMLARVAERELSHWHYQLWFKYGADEPAKGIPSYLMPCERTQRQ